MPFISKNFRIHSKKLYINLFLLRLLSVFCCNFLSLNTGFEQQECVFIVHFLLLAADLKAFVEVILKNDITFLWDRQFFQENFVLFRFAFLSEYKTLHQLSVNFFNEMYGLNKMSSPTGCCVQVASCGFSGSVIFNVPVDRKSQRPY